MLINWINYKKLPFLAPPSAAARLGALSALAAGLAAGLPRPFFAGAATVAPFSSSAETSSLGGAFSAFFGDGFSTASLLA